MSCCCRSERNPEVALTKMFSDAAIHKRQYQHLDVITSKRRSTSHVAVQSHSPEDRLLKKEHVVHGDRVTEQIRALENEVRCLNGEVILITEDYSKAQKTNSYLRLDNEDKSKRISELEALLSQRTSSSQRDEETHQQYNLKQDINDEQQQSTRHYEKGRGVPTGLQAQKQPDDGTSKETEVRHANQRDIDDLEKENRALQEEKQAVNDNLNKEKRIRKEIQLQCEEVEEQLLQLQHDHDKLKKDIMHYAEKQRDYENLKQEMVALRNEKLKENDQLRQQVAVIHKSKHQEEVELTKQLTELQQHHEQMKEKLKNLQKEKQRDYHKLSEKLTASEEEKKAAQMQLNEKIRKLENELIDKSTMVEQLHVREAKLSSTLARRDEHISSMEKNLDARTTEIKRKEAGEKSRHSELSQEITELKSRNSELNQERMKVKGENDELTSSKKLLHLEITKLKSKLNKKEEEVQDRSNENKTLSQRLQQLRSEHNSVQENLGGQIENLQRDNNKSNMLIQELQKEKAHFVKKLDISDGELEILRLNKKQLVQELETEQINHQTSRRVLEQQKVTLQREITELSSTVLNLQQNVAESERQLDEKQEAYDKIHEEKEQCMREVSQLQTERQTLQDQTDSLNRTVKELASTLKAKEQQNIDKLIRELEKSTQTGQYHRQETSTRTEAQREVDKKSKSSCSFTAGSWKDAKHNEQERLRSELDRISQEKDQIQKKYDNLTLELSQLDQTNSEQRNQITHLVMRLLRTSRSGMGKAMVDMVTRELTRQVGGRLDPRNFDFSIVPSETSAGVSKGPLFVVCLNSMVGKNVPDALEGPKGGRNVYLLILHQTTRENVSTLRPDSRRNTGSELQQLGGVIDMVFSSESGLFECDVNSAAVEQIATVLKKY